MRAIIFDVDGTLAETEDLHRRSFNKAFAELHVDRMWPDIKAGWCWDRDTYRRLLKTTGGKERISAYLHDDLALDPTEFQAMIADIHTAKTRWFSRLLEDGDIAPRPGIERIISMASAAGVSLAIATTTSRRNVDVLCEALFRQSPNDIFQAIICGEDVAHKKPAPDVYQLALARLTLMADACIALEDSRNGMMAAKAAGLRCVVSPSVYMQEECFEEADLFFIDYSWEVIEHMLLGV